MKFKIKGVLKKITIFMLVFTMSLGVLSGAASAKNSDDWGRCVVNNKEYYKKIVGDRINSKDIKADHAYRIYKLTGERLYLCYVYVTNVSEKSTFSDNNIEVKGFYIDSKDKFETTSDYIMETRELLTESSDESISARGISYYKNKLGELVGQYDVKENTPYVILEYCDDGEEHYKIKRVYVQRVFEDPLGWGIFGTIRKVEGIDLVTGETDDFSISDNCKFYNHNKVYSMIEK